MSGQKSCSRGEEEALNPLSNGVPKIKQMLSLEYVILSPNYTN